MPSSSTVQRLKEDHDLEGLVSALRYQGDPILRGDAAVALGELDDLEAVEFLIRSFLEDPDPTVQKAARAALDSLVGSEANGVVERTPDIVSGRAFSWELGNSDQANIKYALGALVEIGRQAGALRAFIPTEPGIELPLDANAVARFRSALDGFPITMNSLRLTTAHPQGGNGMYGDGSRFKRLRVVDGEYRVDGFDNVFVADASLFPSTITVNPQWTIMAMSSLAAQSVLRNTQ